MKTLILIIAMSIITVMAQAQVKPQRPLKSSEQTTIDLMISNRKTGNKIIAIGLAVTASGLATYYFADKAGNNGVKNGGIAIASGGIAITFTGILKK